jgi:hypothetical protein
MPIFVGPTLTSQPGRPEELWFVKQKIGKTVLKKDGVWRTVMTPQEDYMATCEVVLRGGYVNHITNELATELTAAGYGDYITED